MDLGLDKALTKKLFQNQSSLLLKFILSNTYPWNLLDQLEQFARENNNAKQFPHVAIEGDVFIGQGCEIRPGAYLRGPVVIGARCVIGHGVEIVRSIILDDAKIAHFNYVGDSIVGSHVNMGAGSICANVRLDKGEISVIAEGRKIPTGRKKLGALIGDGASIGCNAVLNPGTIVLPRALVHPCRNVGGCVE